MSFFSKLGKLARTAGQAYLAYQTGGLSALATQALEKRGGGRGAPMPMLANTLSSKYGGGYSEAAFNMASMGGALRTVGRYGGAIAGRAVRVLGPVGTAVTAAELAKEGYKLIHGHGKKKHRRINPANVKALRRSIRRIKGAEKLFRTVLQVQGKHHAGIKPKTHRRRK